MRWRDRMTCLAEIRDWLRTAEIEGMPQELVRSHHELAELIDLVLAQPSEERLALALSTIGTMAVIGAFHMRDVGIAPRAFYADVAQALRARGRRAQA